MSRWEPNARGRLVEAALTLYSERGFEQTTAADIARQAGLTERTYFRHFKDKREVLFWGAAQLEELFVTAVTGAPDSATPIEAIAVGLDAAAHLFEDRREASRQRQAVIVANAELRERELIKLANLAAAVAGALRDRGVPDTAASLAAEIAIAVFKIGFERWLDDHRQREFRFFTRESLAQLKTVTAGK
ncbi:TetR/AcrR family transcriptional regulator [Fodinicola feengrottensis]|uniref:TetR/AcrR family transcriptional regulator n=1 Tax=Fodinicola feengrottensis TaxID=435914 RepID=A0ABP4T6Z3_9ACTN